MKEFAKQFYLSPSWRKARKAYAKYRGGLCERCLDRGVVKAGEIVHHKVHLSPDNINDEAITLGWDNLELVCRECHAEEHEQRKKRYKIDEFGNVTVVVNVDEKMTSPVAENFNGVK